ncbi:hypothetical protein AXG93_2480s1000 [Marchantia polymorpha subsp. ruderalis]|uniref:Plant heme peroxidase family profile domain-containing protein n=1 Tax=Marchantia polymorpha subsp. ruderalis TaxID=1480154 RepID=A0A176WJZ8_MARPO|nr:hypothetical protein AXG93_2480s1000 [Marchantia polymorpha subsp. ruderalis]
MASSSPRTLLLLVLAVAVVVSDAQSQLSETFYDATCPQAASIVQQKVNAFVDADRGLAAALMRLHFHDCFVRGCDGSVLLNSTDTMLTEKEALLNKGSLRGFEQIDEIKMELECACPDNFTQLVARFARVGLDARDMVILSGGHSIGQVHCGAFFERLYNFQGLNITDPSMDPEFAAILKVQCPQTKPFGFMALDATNGTFDSAYYLDLLTNKGLLESDVALLSDPLGVEYAIRAVQDPMAFLNEFGWAMIKMGAIPALEPYGWRRHCAFVEPKY